MSSDQATVEGTPAPWRAPSPLPTSCQGERVVVRYWQPEDAAGMLAALDVDRASFLPYLPWTAVDNFTVPQCTYHIERMRRDRERASPPADDFTMGIFDRATGEALGGTGLHRVRHEFHQAEIGYWIRPDRRREGLCTEAVGALITWAVRPQADGGWGLRRIEILCAGSNVASQRVPRKLVLRQEQCLRGQRWTPGVGWDDTLGWGVLAAEWDVGAGRAISRPA